MPNLNKESADRVYLAGQQMSNWLYNLSQSSEFSRYRQSMKEMVEKWDACSGMLRPKPKRT